MSDLFSTLPHQSRVIEMFRRAAARGRLAHAYLLIGPEGCGKEEFAKLFAQAMLCRRSSDAELDACGECVGCKQVLAGTHPDLLSVGLPEGKSELPIDVFVGSPERRGKEGLCYEFSLKPMMAGRRLAIISDADAMNEASANALLKTLEEPPDQSILILMAEEMERLLTTIKSRCQIVYFASSPNQTREESPEHAELRRQIRALLNKPPLERVPLATEVLKVIEALGKETSTQREAAQIVFETSIESIRAQMWSECGVEQEHFRPWPTGHDEEPERLERYAVMIEATLQASYQISRYASIPLIIEGWLDQIVSIAREGMSSQRA